jgi:chromosome segregation ATPase
MKIASIQLRDFKRFTELAIQEIPESAQLVVMLGPNGSGKSSVFDAFNFWIGQSKTGNPFQADYHVKASSEPT